MRDYPNAPARIDHVEPVPRRIRGIKDGVVVVDTLAALYVWEWAFYPHWYLPAADVRTDLLHPEGDTRETSRGRLVTQTLDTGTSREPEAADRVTEARNPLLADTIRFEWAAMDAWYEEDEEVFVHPRNPYTRVDALRSSRYVRIEVDGVLLAESSAPVLVFETGLPTRYYLDRTAVRWEHLVSTGLETACPYKGRTTGYWSARLGDTVHPDLAWCYDFPTRQLLPVAGLVAFLNERVDITLDGTPVERPSTHFS